MSDTSEFVQFLGRLHPMLVHLPIGFLLLLGSLEAFSRVRRFSQANASAGYVLALLLPALWCSALCGWLLAGSGGYDSGLLKIHRALGLASAFFGTWVAVCYWRKWSRPYGLSLCANVVLLAVTAHFGGSLTHGADYLAQYAPRPLKALLRTGARPSASNTASEGQQLFDLAIRPILLRRCGACHNPEKHKGGLCVLTLADLFRGGENGPVIIPGDVEHSPMIHRLLLPAESEDHMPPDGKPQPTAGEIALLRWWVETGIKTSPGT